MPLYTYVCEEGHEFDVQQLLADAPLTVCDQPKHPLDESETCGAKCKKVINFKGAIRVQGGTPKFYS